mmetsp:Transcript_44707/g.129193  ORF Transcript_44707/g.129193 Transcript_44707/m.129193 type:complete len:318 (-) Transcript_44707:56-1009(-)
MYLEFPYVEPDAGYGRGIAGTRPLPRLRVERPRSTDFDQRWVGHASLYVVPRAVQPGGGPALHGGPPLRPQGVCAAVRRRRHDVHGDERWAGHGLDALLDGDVLAADAQTRLVRGPLAVLDEPTPRPRCCGTARITELARCDTIEVYRRQRQSVGQGLAHAAAELDWGELLRRDDRRLEPHGAGVVRLSAVDGPPPGPAPQAAEHRQREAHQAIEQGGLPIPRHLLGPGAQQGEALCSRLHHAGQLLGLQLARPGHDDIRRLSSGAFQRLAMRLSCRNLRRGRIPVLRLPSELLLPVRRGRLLRQERPPCLLSLGLA